MGTRSARNKGILTSWNDERGYGFIALDAQNPKHDSVFAHISAFPHRSERPAPGERLSFKIQHTDDGKTRAHKIRYLAANGRVIRTRGPRTGAMSYTILAAFGVAVAIVTGVGALPPWFAALYLLMSIITFISYAVDKRAAEKHHWRVSESALLGLGLIGGWPGAIVAQQQLRHKIRKPSFAQAFWATVIFNVLVLAALTTALGDRLLELARLLLGESPS